MLVANANVVRNNRTSRRYCFTLNNFTPLEELRIDEELGSSAIKYAIVGNERGLTGTPHKQGFIIFHNPVSFNTVKRLLGRRAHIEQARGSSGQARDYCRKDGDFKEWGTFPERQGKRSDLDDLIEWSESFEREHGRPVTSPDLAKYQPKAYIRYPRFVLCAQRRSQPLRLEFDEPREWQAALEEELLGNADDRTVVFYIDPQGAQGKTWFQRWFLNKHSDVTQLLSIGKREDLTMMIDPTKKVFLFNIPRGAMEYLQYNVMEFLKDGMVPSVKYHSHMKFLAHKCHVVIFANEYPDMTKLSEDRYDIRTF